MTILLRLRYILLLFWLVQSLGAFADKGSKHPTEDKPDKPRKALGIPPTVLPNVIKLENPMQKGVASTTVSKTMMLQNAQLSNALDKAVAQMGDAMSLMDYSELPAERAEVFVDASTNADRAEAEALFDEITKGNRYIKSINNGAVLALPQGIRWGDVDEAGNSKGGNSITVGIASATFKPEYTVLKMYVKIEIETPAGGGNVASSPKKTLFFGSDNIKLSQDGGFIGDTRLVLLGDYKIPFGKYDFIMRGGLNKSTGAFADFTYVSIDCNGFRELKVSGSLQFPTNVLVKIDPITGVVETGKNVIGEIAATVYDINDLRFDVSLPAFALASAPTWGFVVQGATFDFSTRTNSPGTVFPEKYAADYFPPESDGSLAINTWRGVFVKNLEVLLPKEFRKKVDKNKTIFARQKITAQNLLIDERGISGSFSKEPVIQLNEGDASGWDFSVDKIRVDFETNKLVGGAFNGIIQLPISQDATAQLAYSGEIAPVGDMALTVTLKDGISFDAFKGYIKLTEGTSVKFETKNGYFIPTATINGEMGIYVKNIKDAPAQPARPAQPEILATATTPSTPAVPATLAKPAVVGGEKATTVAEKEDATVQIPSITVQGLVLTGDPTKPWISLAYAGYEKEMKLSFFPASITKLALAVNQNECSLVLGVKVAIMKDNFAATTVLKLNGAVTPDKKIVVGSPAITVENIKLEKVDLGAFIIDGEAEIKENRVEKGWGGSLAFSLKDPSIKIASATAAFGYNKTENYRYWFIGASFGNSQWASDNDKPKVGVFQIGHITFAAYSNCIPKGIISANDNLSASVVAKKGIIGFKGAVGLKTPALSGEAGLEVAISDTWGVKRISFVGNAELNAKPSASNVANVEKNQKEQTGETNINKSTDKAVADKKAEAPSKAFAIRLNILRDFDQGIFHGECDFYVNIGVMKGNQPNGLAGKIVSHVETKANNPKYPGKNMWYFHVGNPDSRITVGATLMGNTFKTGFYFMTGFGLPAAPAMPAFYQKALGYKSTKYQKPNYGDLASGTFGTAFGAELYYQQRREMGMGVVYAYYSFKFGLGFDFITRDCATGLDPSGNPTGGCAFISSNGKSTWLSSAQAYAYLEGSAGVGVKVWLFRGEVEIINAGVGALISANFPKPSGGCANLIVWYKIWKYRGSFDVEYKFGEKCDNCAGQSIGCPRDSYN